jgi:hypothetical protein
MRNRAVTPVLLMLVVLAGLGSFGCSQSLKNTILPNERPTMRLTYAPVDTTHAEFYTYQMYWTGFDADGRVVRYEYAIDPPSDAGADTQWVSTIKNEQTFTFSASVPGDPNATQPISRDFHVFAIRALDNRGLYSEPVVRAFYSFGVAPRVIINSPKPNALLSPSVTPAVRIAWTGYDYTDANGYVYEKPLYYKYKLFKSDSDPRWSWWLSHPDSMRLNFAPRFVGWDSTGPDSPFVQYTNLVPNSEYLFVVVAFGRSGAYSPVWTLNNNMLKMAVGLASQLGPAITLYNSFFSYTYKTGGFPQPLNPSWAVQLQVPSGAPVTFNWTAEPPPGSVMRRYRWVLDLVALDDETERTGQDDWYHWSDWSLTTSATVGPFTGAGGDTGEVHNFYVEAEDINGLVSLGWVQFRVFKPTFDRDLLVMDDTRLKVDQFVRGRTDTLIGPTGNWPTRAEKDTFLFAVGGVRWRMQPDSAMKTQPGLFKGYNYDTMSTRHGQENPTLALSVLGQYRHIIWSVDQTGSYYETSPTSAISPMTTLNYMSKRNRQNTLATWVSQGGALWAMGGGFGNATNTSWNQTPNDLNGVRTYTTLTNSAAPTPDLGPGRFMYDLMHWRSEFRVFEGYIQVARLDQHDPTSTSARAWQGEPLRDARYYNLPPLLQSRTPASDPLSLVPFRSAANYYINNSAYSSSGLASEFMTYENIITETRQVTPDSSYEYSALDTLYLAYGKNYTREMLQAGSGVNSLMTYYHGTENGPVLFLGTALWDYRRTQCQQLVDFVLGDLWGMTKAVPGLSYARAHRSATAVSGTKRAQSASSGAAVGSSGTRLPGHSSEPLLLPVRSSNLERRR